MKKILTFLYAMLLLHIAAMAQVTNCPDANEPNNITTAATQVAALPYNTAGCVGGLQDQDWFAITANNTNYLVLCRGFSANTTGAYNLDINVDTQGTLTITTAAPSPGLNTDTYLELYDAGGVVQLAQNDDAGVGFYSQIVYTTGTNPLLPISVVPAQASVTGLAGTTTLSVAAMGSYTFASSDTTWLTAFNTTNGSSTNGTGNAVLLANYAANTSPMPRTALISITDSTGFSAVFYISQQGSSTPPPPCVDVLEPNNVQTASSNISALPYNNQTVCLTQGDHDWYGFAFGGLDYFVKARGFSQNNFGAYGIDITSNSATTFIITTIDVNNTNIDTYLELYNANSIQIAQNDDYNGRFQSQINYNILQPSLSVSPQSNTVPDSAGTISINVASNGAWATNNGNAATWITINQPSSGTGNGTISLSYAANPYVTNRTGYVTVAGNGLARNISITQQGRTGPNACTTDPYEPNNTAATAASLVLPVSNGNLCLNATDEDWFGFIYNGVNYLAKCTISPNATTPTATGAYGINIFINNNTFTISTYNIAGVGTPTDTYLELYDSTGVNLLASNDNQTQNSVQSRISYPQAIIDATPTVRFVQSVAGSTTFAISTTNPATIYTIISNDPWINITSPSSNAGNTTVAAVYAINPTNTTRTGTITVAAGVFMINLTITQYGTNGGGTGGVPCTDPTEPNNTIAAATQIVALPYNNANTCLSAGDHDWFGFTYNNTNYLVKCRGFSQSTQGAYILDIVPTATGFEITTSTVPGTSSTNTDTYLELYDGIGNNQLAQNDDFGGTFFSQISYNLQNVYLNLTPSQLVVNSTAGMDSIYVSSNITYATNTMSNWITISSTGGTGNGGIAITYTANPNTWNRTGMVRLMGAGMMRSVYVTQLGSNGGGGTGGGNTPPNDDVCSAQQITVDSICNNTLSTNVAATYNVATPNIINNCPTPYSADVWFMTQMPASGTMTLRTTALTLNDAVMAVYEGTCNNLMYIDCEDDNFAQGGGLMPVMTINRPAGTDIFVRIYGFAGQQGDFEICAVDYATPTFAAATPAELATNKTPRTAILSSTVRTYPNPVRSGNDLYLTLENATLSGTDIVKVYDMLGKVVLNTNINATRAGDVLKLKTNDMAQGLYYLQIETADGKVFGEKVRIEK